VFLERLASAHASTHELD